MAALLLTSASLPAAAQVSCNLASYALNISLTGGGQLESGGLPALFAPGSTVSLAVTCEGSGAFPPPVIDGATYRWSTGETSQRIQVFAPPPDQSVTYSVAVTGPNGSRTLSGILTGAPAGAPVCGVTTATAQPMSVGTTFTVSAECSPSATSFAWDARSFLGTISFLSPANGPSAILHIDSAQPGDVLPVYLTPSNASGRGPFASLLVSVGNPDAHPPLNAAALAAGGAHTCALSTAGGVRCWGDDTDGQLGDYRGAILYSTTPANVIGVATNVISIASGFVHSCALRAAGDVVCWGDNARGELGDGTLASGYAAVRAIGLGGVLSISASAAGSHTCAVVSGGAVKCWGRGDFGQLGNGALLDSPSPTDVSGLSSGTLAVAVGGDHTCALTSARAVKCWGRNTEGELGNATTSNSALPVDVMGLAGPVASIAAAFSHTCALLVNGKVECWGWNLEGELGSGSPALLSASPVEVSDLSGVTAIAAGGNHTCAIVGGEELRCWGRNTEGALGDGTLTNSAKPVAVRGLSRGVRAVSGGGFHTCAVVSAGGVLCWGHNGSGRLGDGTTAWRATPQLVVGPRGAGFLDLTVEDGFTAAGDQVPIFPAVASATPTDLDVTIQYRPQDVGTVGSVFVFALAPANIVKRDPTAKALALRLMARGTSAKDTPVQCVLAQLSATGELHEVSASALLAYVTGVLSGAGQAVKLLNGVPAASIGGATFYVGYGTDSAAMLNEGTNRSVASVPGTVTCQPQPPQTGWWWNPAEAGRGYSIEARGSNLFYASFLYDAGGRATWSVASGPTSLDGSLFIARLNSVRNGQTLSGDYRRPDTFIDQGTVTLAFNDATHGTMIWPGGTVPIERQPFVPDGLSLAPVPNQPENGWWWNEQESGRGFFMEWQGQWLDIAGYMYDDAGNPTWYIAAYPSPDPRSFAGSWWQFANGQTLTGPYAPATRVNDHVAPLTIQFQGPDTALMTLPNGRSTRLTRQRF